MSIGEYRGIKDYEIFMRYVRTRYIQSQRELAYRIFVTDELQALMKASGIDLKTRYIDFIENMDKPQDNRTADEIAEDFIRTHNLRKEE